MDKIILLIFVIICSFFMMVKKEQIIKLLYVTLIAVPIGSTNIILDKLDVFSIKGVGINLIHCIIILLTIASLKDIITKLINNKKVSFLIIIYTMLSVLAVVFGIINKRDLVSDGQKYFIFIIWGCIVWSQLYGKLSIEKFIYLTILGININFILNIMLNVARPATDFLLISNVEIISEESGFVSSAANISLVTMGYSLYYILDHKLTPKKMLSCILNIMLSLVNNIIFSGNRTYLILAVLLIVLVAFSSETIRKIYKKNKKSVIIVCILCFFGLITAVISNDTIMRKIDNVFQKGMDVNLVTRGKTVVYYMKEIIVSPIGYGFGKELPLINQYGRFHGNSLYTDNAFINIGMKIGIVGMLVFIGNVVVVIKNLY